MNRYEILGITEDDLGEQIYEEIQYGLSEYVVQIAEKITNRVAMDICETADVKKWNNSDLRLAIGRVILKAVGGEV